jgi:hypothetical protein
MAWSLPDLRARAVAVYRAGAGSRPDVLRIRLDDGEVALKDYSASDVWFRRLIAPILIHREVRALRRLEGLPGVPRLIGQVGRRALVLEHVDAVPAKTLNPSAITPELFARIEGVVRATHRRGVAHCDLRASGNILVGADGQPYLVDFVAHVGRGGRWNVIGRWAFARFCQADLAAVVRLKRRLAPELLSPDDLLTLGREQGGVVGRIARVAGRAVRTTTRFLFTRDGATRKRRRS